MLTVERHRKILSRVETSGSATVKGLARDLEVAEEALERFNIKKLFLSCKGFDPSRGLSAATDEHARIKRRMMELAERTFLLIDNSKFGVKAVEFFASTTDVDVVITDSGTDPGMIEKLKKMGIVVDVAGRLGGL